MNFHSPFLIPLCAVAELVLWSPIGDQYALSVGKTITVYDVSVSKQMSIQLSIECYEIIIMITSTCVVFCTQTGESAATFDMERPVNCFTFIQVRQKHMDSNGCLLTEWLYIIMTIMQ